jgi:tetraacyldisaccharide 4'-kinase
MRESERTPRWAYALWPLGACFLGAARLRAAAYEAGLRRRVPLPHPAVSIGNLTFGGTGKTPVTIAVARILAAMGRRPAVLLRGYGRKSAGARLVGPGSTSSDVGEEALLIARSLAGVPVAVGEKREEAAALAPADTAVFVLDDAFQHLRVRRDVDILLVDASRPGDLHAPPVGRLREPLRAAERAGVIVVTRGGEEDLPAALRPRVGAKPVLSVRFRWGETLGPDGAGTLSEWRGRRVLLFAGVGNPAGFQRSAREAGFDPQGALLFPDHAEPDPERIRAVLDRVRAGSFEGVLTTEKDAVKWLPVWPGPIPLLFCRLETDIEDPGGHLEKVLGSLAGGRA